MALEGFGSAATSGSSSTRTRSSLIPGLSETEANVSSWPSNAAFELGIHCARQGASRFHATCGNRPCAANSLLSPPRNQLLGMSTGKHTSHESHPRLQPSRGMHLAQWVPLRPPCRWRALLPQTRGTQAPRGQSRSCKAWCATGDQASAQRYGFGSVVRLGALRFELWPVRQTADAAVTYGRQPNGQPLKIHPLPSSAWTALFRTLGLWRHTRASFFAVAAVDNHRVSHHAIAAFVKRKLTDRPALPSRHDAEGSYERGASGQGASCVG